MMREVSFTRVRQLDRGPLGFKRQGTTKQQFSGFIRVCPNGMPEPIEDKPGCTVLYQTVGGNIAITNEEAGYP